MLTSLVYDLESFDEREEIESLTTTIIRMAALTIDQEGSYNHALRALGEARRALYIQLEEMEEEEAPTFLERDEARDTYFNVYQRIYNAKRPENFRPLEYDDIYDEVFVEDLDFENIAFIRDDIITLVKIDVERTLKRKKAMIELAQEMS